MRIVLLAAVEPQVPDDQLFALLTKTHYRAMTAAASDSPDVVFSFPKGDIAASRMRNDGTVESVVDVLRNLIEQN